MLDITPYSIITEIVITNIFILIFIIIFKKNCLLHRINIGLLLFTVVSISIRLLIPIEFLFCSKAVNSFEILPTFDAVISKNITVNESISITVWTLICLIWLLGFIIALIFYFHSYFMICKRIKLIKPTDDKRILNCINKIKSKNNLNFNVKVIVNSAIKFPAEIGYFNKIIFINKYNYSDEDLYCILKHELSHYTIKSNWVKLLTNFVGLIFWWNPITKVFKKYVDRLLELSVDSYVTKNLSKKSKANYLNCILNVYKTTYNYNTVLHNHANTLTDTSEKQFLKRRFEYITKHKSFNLKISALFLFILVLYIFASFRYVVQPAYNPTAEDLSFPNFNADNSYIIKEGNIYTLYYNNEIYLKANDKSKLPNVPITKK